ncbi:TIGR03564 family F420-dependent LLM class oxidoreductase [Actinomadura miaoliensis]|uniref:TIGR03564 family F420-dependent LLM class oxidoreductase n=1 Tax=Actinomadura miaoliensis TaxID=430685 RepID=A0ABP7WWH7_9ACTN
MRIGTYVPYDGTDLDGIIGRVRAAADAGLDAVYFTQQLSWDALTVAALAGREVPGIDIGVAVVPTYPRHPLALAGQALSAQAASGNRLVLGLGPSHAFMMEGWFGYSYDRPVRHVREYLTALRPLLRGENAEFRGETLTAVGRVDVPGVEAPPVLLSALGPQMLRVAGRLADGTVTTWTTPQVIADHVAPSIVRAAEEAGRPAPRVVVTTLASVTADPDGLRRTLAEQFAGVADMPAYKAILERQGLSGPGDTIVAGDEAEVERAVRAYRDAGATELMVAPMGTDEEVARTIELAAALRRTL